MQAIVVNSGIANCTGEQGLRDAQTMQQWAAEKLHIKKNTSV